MRVIIPNIVLGNVFFTCLKRYPNEACGVIGRAKSLNDGYGVYELTNVSSFPQSQFHAGASEQLAVWAEMERRGETPVIAFHSHTRPNAPHRPSTSDIENHDWDMLMLIVHLNDPTAPRVTLWREGPNQTAEEHMLTVRPPIRQVTK